MPYLERWIIGFMVAAIGISGLYVASLSSDSVMYVTGILFFVAAVAFNFYQINTVFEEKKAK